jgi:hypothetical protein
MKILVMIGVAAATGVVAALPIVHRSNAATSLKGDYVEIRSCDVFTGPCFANGEMGLTGREAILTWSIAQGAWHGVPLAGLKVLAIVHSQNTLGNMQQDPPQANAVLLVDAAASTEQAHALTQFARQMGGALLEHVVQVERAPISVSVRPPTCPDKGCSTIHAGKLVEIKTRCLGGGDHVCGNEECYYPPLTTISDARPAYTVIGSFDGQGLGVRFDDAGRRSAYLGTFNL